MIIAGTKNDTTNLAIAVMAKKINPNIKTIVRENEMEDFSVFQNTKVNHILMPSRILIDKTINAIIRPTADTFARNIHKLTEQDAILAIKTLLKIDNQPLLEEITVSKNETHEIHKRLTNNEEITLDIFRKSLSNKHTFNNVFILMIARGESEILLPQWDEPLCVEDTILFGCDRNADKDIMRIANNPYEFEYAFYGREKSNIPFFGKRS
jgi:Trk K+ transport system NAD-binding subunit